MSNAAQLQHHRPHDQLEIAERIRVLAEQGLKPRDISALLHIHPMIVIRELERAQVTA